MMTASLNMQHWQKAARELFGYQTKRNLQDFVNGQALALVNSALRATKRADADRITRELERVSGAEYSVYKRGKKAGKINWSKVRKFYDESSLVIRILAKRMRETGDWGVRGTSPTDSIQDVARKYVARRRGSVAFIRSGWIPAIRELWSALKSKPAGVASIAGARLRGQPKGGASIARFAWDRPVNALVWNTALITGKDGKSSHPEPVAQEGLDTAFAKHAADMGNHLKKLMDREFRRTANA